VSDVGIRELRDHLSRYISQVREGSEVTVTDHGRAVARIVPLDRPRLLDQLIEEGLVTPAGDERRSRPQHRIATSEPVSPLVTDQRR
jgi:prevent-host-death family protein